ncbi:LysR family transcriptional regulator [Phaeovulum veldkampii]|uniref:Transcriptional regulator n=2 Tax=Phaeovulum veldkampii TaxID=33049 RepID=A0A2T4JK07_9RHOB|nr:LysR substrate-binding domain-containing protein [Phaeovulum veldkampii]NCU19479.1 LysR family transcriptional regulator [Candidatus Falkowbacteria bacterium]PTE18215.1 transcriptional regulator [Phaeovulum veldkampii DSM 11550]TDQ63484.1 DNA-binding transcriptional LysR family regulator [Phaeovulum veldkampii DSM 11550]
MDTRQLRYFVAIHDQGTLTGAADQERTAVSALSYHLANLEAELGTALFTRKPRGMTPTAAGERLYPHARAILRALEAAERDISSIVEDVAGEVSVGMAHSVVKAIGVDLVRHVLRDYPRLRLSLTEGLLGSTLVHLLASEVDMALVYNPPATPGLRARPVLEERLVCLGRADVIGNSDAPLNFDEVLDFPIILLRRGASARAVTDDAVLLRRLEERAQLQLNSIVAIAGALQAGLGCLVGPAFLMRDHLVAGHFRARPIEAPELWRRLYLCEREDRPPTRATEVTRDLVLSLLRQKVGSGDWDARLIDPG